MDQKFSKSVFLVATDDARDSNSVFVKFLKDEGFKDKLKRGADQNCPWIYVDIVNKLYSFAIAGVKICDFVGDHAIRLNEFNLIYEIFDQYKGKDIFTFKNERFDYDD